MNEDYIKVGIYSKENIFVNRLKNKFKEKHLAVEIFDDFKDVNLRNISYLIINLLDDSKGLENIKDLIKDSDCKIIVLSPANNNWGNLINLNINLGIIVIPKEIEFVDSINLDKISEKIVKETLSFGISGQIISLINYIDFNKFIPKKVEKKINENDAILLPSSDLIKSSKIVNKNRKTKLPSKLFKKIISMVIVLGLLSLTPFILILLSLGSMYLSYKSIEKSNENLSYRFIKTTSFLSQTSKSISFGIPFYYNFSNLLIKSSVVSEEIFSLGKLSKELMLNVLGDKIYDLEFYSNGISASLDKIHTDVSFLQSDIDEQDGNFGKIIKNYLINNKIEINVIKNKIYELRNLATRATTLLGFEKPKKYLILFQNNMELRPTGGFIGSFAIISFDKGRLTEIVVNDIYSADGQLNGHVDPPEPILKILGEGGWYMRDSNWDPDFPTSASKAEWFLDKEMDSQVDGVIAIDLNFIQGLLKITGPINLVDYKKMIDQNNLYQTTQSEVESEFFPGSIKKASFLTSLSKNLITEIENLPSDKYFLFFKEVYKSLEERHIQIFLHDPNSQNAISSLGYSGEIDTNIDCGLRCVRDNYSLIDANLGINKANYFVNRSQEVNLSVNKEYINHELVVNYVNKASSSVGTQGLYKSYTRLLIPQEASVVSIKTLNAGGVYKDLEFDTIDISNRKEIGFLLEVFPNTPIKVQIVWVLPSDKLKLGGEYDIFIRKQAGTDADSLKINIKSNDLSLTGKVIPVYNTILAKDFSARLFFK